MRKSRAPHVLMRPCSSLASPWYPLPYPLFPLPPLNAVDSKGKERGLLIDLEFTFAGFFGILFSGIFKLWTETYYEK